ncbi:MAG: aldolase/citrate lyase family protein [Pseudomonadota bacterium]
MTQQHNLKQRMAAGDQLLGTFLKTPAYELVEVLAASGLDFICLDAEHAPFDRARLDACLALARAYDLPALVRVATGERHEILQALDCGATGVVVPHVDSVEKARDIAMWGRFGHGGRGYAGSTRWAGFTTKKMPELLQRSGDETIVIAQIEEPEGVELSAQIAQVEGIDGLFVGPADLAVCLGVTGLDHPQVRDSINHVAQACQQHSCCCMTFVPDTSAIPALKALGVTMFYVSSEHGFILQGARAIVQGVTS